MAKIRLRLLNNLTVALSIFFYALVFSGCKSCLRLVCIKGHCIKAEVADTPLARQTGLMHRQALNRGNGMLFIFERPGKYNFWMKNMRFPLDIIWISQEKKIVDVKKYAQPCRQACESLIPRGTVKYALEVNAGFLEENQIQAGDSVDF